MEEVKAFVERKSQTPVAVYFATQEDEPALEIFRQVAQSEERIQFAHTLAPEAREHFEVGQDVRVVLFKSFDEERNDFTEQVEMVSL